MSEQYRECTCDSEFAHESWCMLHEPINKPESKNNIEEMLRMCKRIAKLECQLEEARAKVAELEKQKESWGNEYTAVYLVKQKLYALLLEMEIMQTKNQKMREALEKIAMHGKGSVLIYAIAYDYARAALKEIEG